MKSWHFKKWFQTTLEVITSVCFVLFIGISDIDWSSCWSYVIVFGMMAIISGNILLLNKYGRYE